MRRRRGWMAVLVAVGAFGASPDPARAAHECFGPFTLSNSAMATPASTATPIATPTVYPTASPQPVKIYTHHQFFVSFTDTGDNVDAAPYVIFRGKGPGGVETNLVTVRADTSAPLPGAQPTPSVQLPLNGPGLTVRDTPVRAIYPTLYGCLNCSVTVGWCSAD